MNQKITAGPHHKPQFDIYSTMLVIALVALIIGTVFAYLETMDYGPNKTKGAPLVPVSSREFPGHNAADTSGMRLLAERPNFLPSGYGPRAS